MPFTNQFTALGAGEIFAVNWTLPPVRISALAGVIEADSEWVVDVPHPVKTHETDRRTTTVILLKVIAPTICTED
jgi:hypothetical protein